MVEELEKQSVIEEQKTQINIKLDPRRYERIKELADYTANEGLIPYNYRGNLTAFLDFCVLLTDDWLKERARKNRGF